MNRATVPAAEDEAPSSLPATQKPPVISPDIPLKRGRMPQTTARPQHPAYMNPPGGVRHMHSGSLTREPNCA